MQHGVSGIQYSDNYQQSFDPRYGRGYGAPPTPHQQPQQPNLFVPPQATQVPQTPQVYYIICYVRKKEQLYCMWLTF